MNEMRMLDHNDLKKHIGNKIRLTDRLNNLKKVEQYFVQKCNEERIEYSYDCTANEQTFYNTLNYTSFAGLFIMHPLCYSAQMFQMYDARCDKLPSAGHVEWIESNLLNNDISKYVKPDGSMMDSQQIEDFKAIVVLPGSNKIYEHTSDVKLKNIIARHGKDLVIKPHPITKQAVLDDLENIKGESILADKHSNLYQLIRQANIVYTSHISETALTSLLLGKKISPMEKFVNRLTGSFSHINHFCFTEPDPVPTIKSIFASPKSGIVHPDIDKDWKGKIDKYFEYTLSMRKLQIGHYYQ